MSKKLLEVHKPLLSTSNVYGTLLSIISDDERIRPWIYSNFIQIRYVIDWDVYFFDNHDFLIDICPYINKSTLDRSLITQWTSFKDFIIHAIDNDFYVWCHLDRFYIPGYDEYLKQSNFHETLIYGYDINENTVYFSDNMADGAFKNSTCSFEIIEAANKEVYRERNFISRVILLKKNNKTDNYTINREYIIDGLQRLLFSKRSFDLINNEVLCIYGLDVYHHLSSRITNRKEDLPKLDIRVFHLLWEHKKLMVMRLEYLNQISCLVNAQDLVKESKALDVKSYITRNMVLKYNMKPNKDSLESINRELISIRNNEQILLERILTRI
ncbi:hypothetical protein MKY96_21575 [Paenibacillus sp. FSL R7-0302]|uniref:hypothetical protein n=1 Tax=Paenibacillus sp. FSL R7-0302 TaxID=2921681 RepID=UPI0030F9BE9B